jgi:hypothetical protein
MNEAHQFFVVKNTRPADAHPLDKCANPVEHTPLP